jgi:hypothetical protein
MECLYDKIPWPETLDAKAYLYYLASELVAGNKVRS